MRGDTSSANGHLPRFVFIGVDGSFKGLPYVDYSETRMTVKREDILIAVAQFASGLNDCPHIVEFNSKSPVVQDLNDKFVEARDMTLEINDTARRASIRGIVNMYRVAGLIAGCQLENTVSDEILAALKDVFENEIMPFSIEAQTGGSTIEKKILEIIQWYFDNNQEHPKVSKIKRKMTVKNSQEFTRALTGLLQSGSVIGYIEHPEISGNLPLRSTSTRPSMG